MANFAVQVLAQPIVSLLAGIQRDESVDRGALDVMREADNGSLGDLGVSNQGALDLGGADAMARDIDHVVDAAGNPIIAILVAAAAVAGEIKAGIRFEIGLEEALVIAPH